MKFYGNDNETMVVTEKGVFIIQSIDFPTGKNYEKIDSLPKSAKPIPSRLCFDLEVPPEII